MAECKEISTSAFYSEKDTLALAQEAVKDGLIEQEVVDRLNSLHPQVPSSMKHRYLVRCLRVHLIVERKKNQYFCNEKYDTIIKLFSNGEIDNLLYGAEHISDLTELLLPFAHKWRFIGIALRFQPNDLDSYEACPLLLHDSPKSYLVRLLEDWVSKKFKHTLPPIQNSLEEALKSQTVGLGILVSKLQQIQTKVSNCFYSEKETSTTLEGSISIAEGASTLLEANSGSDSHDYFYEWFQNGLPIRNKYDPPSFLFSKKVDLDDDGCWFTCKKSSGESGGVNIVGPVTLDVSSSLDKFRRSLVLMYLSQPEIPEDTWPPVGNRKFINLALITQRKFNYGSNYARLTIRGDIDDILHDKNEIQYNEVYKSLKSSQLVLIEGRPGSGKTTFVNKLTRDWAANSAGGRIRLVLLVSLRVVNTMLNPELSDLLKLFKDLKVSQELIEQRAGKGVCFIFDGLDEFSPSDSTNSIVYKIIDKSYLRQSTVIVASRPAALSKLRSKADKVIEVLGFLNDQIFEYFDSYPFSDSSKPAKLRTYLSTHPNILHMCYLPIHATMVAFLFEVAGQVPKTETEIYTHFTRSTLIRSLTKSEETEPRLVNFDTLGEKESKQFKQICQLALKKTISSKQVLDEDEVGSYFHTEKDRDVSLGLITIDRTADLYGYKNIFTFLHLTFQEYLAAYHISTLSKIEQIKLFQEHVGKDYMLVVWKFCCGLKIFDTSILFLSDGNTLFHIECAYESQQRTVCEEVLKFTDFHIHLEGKYLSTPDFTAIGYLANTAVVPLKLSIVNCSVNLASIDALLSEMDDRGTSLLEQFHMEAETIEVEVIQRLLANLGSLKSVFVKSKNGIHHRAVSQVPFFLPSVTKLSLSNVSFMLLDKLNYSELITVDLRKSILRFDELVTLVNGLQSCVNLRHLNISGNHIGNDGAKLLSGALKSCKQLERFDVSYCFILHSGIIAILDSIQLLSHLVLKSTDICQYEVSQETLLNFLEPFTNLQSLEIVLNNVNCGLFWSKSRGWSSLEELYNTAQPKYNLDTSLKLCNSFRFLHRLKRLTLRYCIQGVETARALMSGLKHCPELQVLDLSHNTVTPDEIKKIAKNLKYLKNLQELHMCSCCIDDSGAKELSLNLQKLSCLHTVCLSGNVISRDGEQAVAAILQKCPQLTKLDLRTVQ